MASREIDYIAKDFDSIVDALITYATVNFGPDTAANRQWTSFNIDDFSRTWLELVAYIGDLIFFYLDVQATQSNLETATLRSAVLNIAKQFGFVVPTSSSASGLARFTLKAEGSIPTGFKLVAQNGSQFFVSSSSPAPLSTTLDVYLSVLQGIRRVENFVARGVQSEEFSLNFTPVVVDSTNPISTLNSPIVKVNGNDYTLVNSFIRSLPTDRHFRLIISDNGSPLLRFGDGIFGRQLAPNDSVIVNYRTGGGTIGNIPAGTLTTLLDSSSIIASVTNPNAFSGGADEPSLEQLRALVPDSLKTLERAVTIDDYGDIIEANFNSVSQARAERNTLDPGIDVDIYVVPAGSIITQITTNLPLFSAISDFIEERKTVTTTFRILDAFGINILVKAIIYLLPGTSRALIQSNIQTALMNFFSLGSGDVNGTGTKFGQQIRINDLYELIGSIEGVDRFEITKFHYVPRIISTSAIGATYLTSDVVLFPNSEGSEWLIGADYNLDSPEYNTYSVFKKITGHVSNLSEHNITDNRLNLSVSEGTTTGVSTDGSQNILFDFTKSFLVDEFVGGSSPITLTHVSGGTWDFAGAVFTPRTGDRILQNGNTARIISVMDGDTAVLSSGYPNAIVNTGPVTLLKRDEYLVVDAAGNVWTIEDNDSHSILLSAFAINNTLVSDIMAGPYKIVKSLIGQSLLFHDLIFVNIEYNTHNSIFRLNSSFNLVGTIGDQYWISQLQGTKGNFGLPITLDQFESSTPNMGYGRVHCAGNPDLSSITVGIDSNFVLIDSNHRVFEITGFNNLTKTVDILHDASITPTPLASGHPASLAPRYYSDNSEISFVIGLANQNSGLGFQAIGSIAIAKQEILSIVRDTNEVTVTFAEDHFFEVGMTVEIDGVTDASFDGQFIIDLLPASTQLVYTQADVNATSTGGTVSHTGYNIDDAKTFTLDDGTNPTVTFEFNKSGGVSPGNIEIPFNDTDNAEDIKNAIKLAINTTPSLAISADDGTGIYKTNEVVFLQNSNTGVSGNVPISPPTLNISGITFSGMSGGIGTGHGLPTPITPGTAEVVNDLGLSSSGEIVDHFKFHISGYLDDIVNLRNSEIPQISLDNIELDFRGGVA